ncbi:XRE family transcriptional regulator [Bacteriovorax stolpii]|mgnify:CR=1 FL=1|uniref:XRE family transcriptional regulator n=1 Tax=Bacteriovorax stolpii TaxID=960 RepID=A0A2K9NP78_BACTC|nr:helix-turn-helix transcriptional regulator [Bacteriovorax stolpii]AUN97307.1 XRE family transcriptional regulator [Bacteriovorax stolpii]QDK42755.1 XRE family transcriptional regulator [Bacteriovorax stolpii]TDP52477.1 DNA-binding XRE family transcriptional regulator [Bacteriovorax stolpii]
MTTKKNETLSLGGFLKAHRQGEELSQTEFAKFLGISKQRLCDLEKDKSNVSIKLCITLAKKIGVPPEWLAKLSIQHQLRKENLKLKIQ